MLEIISTKYCQNSATFFSLNDLLLRGLGPCGPSGSATYGGDLVTIKGRMNFGTLWAGRKKYRRMPLLFGS